MLNTPAVQRHDRRWAVDATASADRGLDRGYCDWKPPYREIGMTGRTLEPGVRRLDCRRSIEVDAWISNKRIEAAGTGKTVAAGMDNECDAPYGRGMDVISELQNRD